MWAIVLVRNGDLSLDELFRGLASLVIAWQEGYEVNILVNGEVPINENRMDHVGYGTKVPIDIKSIIDSSTPSIIIEDSASKQRLKQRINEIGHVELPKAFLYVNRSHQVDKNLILSLKKVDNVRPMYEMVTSI